MVTDGPFAETKEQLGGFYLLECENLDEALEWAKKIPLPDGAIEVRPVMDYEAFGDEEPAGRGGGSLVGEHATASSTACSGRSRGGRSRP